MAIEVNGAAVEFETAVDKKTRTVAVTAGTAVVATELWTGKTLKLSEPVLRQVLKCHDCAVFRMRRVQK